MDIPHEGKWIGDSALIGSYDRKKSAETKKINFDFSWKWVSDIERVDNIWTGSDRESNALEEGS